MKQIIILSTVLFCGLICNAQSSEQIDTLKIKSVLYQSDTLVKENWPAETILKSKTDFHIGNMKLEIADRLAEYNNIFYIVSDSNDNLNILEYAIDKSGTISIKFSDYEFVCQNQTKARVLDVNPSFMGGDANAFSVWVNQRLVYPELAKENGVQGRVLLKFTINTDGSVSDVIVLNGVDPALDQEAVRVVSSSPKWTPGILDGIPVRVTYTFPCVFQLW